MEVVVVMLLIVIAIELVLILVRITEDKSETIERPSRRNIEGIFANPLGDSYRKNTKGLYRPIRPHGGDEEDDL